MVGDRDWQRTKRIAETKMHPKSMEGPGPQRGMTMEINRMNGSRLQAVFAQPLLVLAILAALIQSGCSDSSDKRLDPVAQIGASDAPPVADSFGMILKRPDEVGALKALALSGDEAAMTNAIDMFIRGVGVEIDYREAYLLAVKGTEMGMLDAKATLGKV